MFFLLLFFCFSDEEFGRTFYSTQAVSGEMTFRNCLFIVENERPLSLSSGCTQLNLIQCTFQNTHLSDGYDGSVFSFYGYNNPITINFQFVCIYNCICGGRGGAFCYWMHGESQNNFSMSYLTINMCQCPYRIIYIVEGYNNPNTYNMKHCNFSQSITFGHDIGMYLFCNIKTNFGYCSFENNTANRCLLYLEQTNQGYSISNGAIDTCNFMSNTISTNELIMFRCQSDYTIQNTIIKENEMSDQTDIRIFGLTSSNILLVNCKIQTTMISGSITTKDSIISNMLSFTTHPLAFYRTLHCFAEKINSPIVTQYHHYYQPKLRRYLFLH